MTTANTYWVRIKDAGTDDGKLFDGEDVIIHCDSLKINGASVIQTTPKGFQNPDLTTADNGSIGSNFNRRKANVSYKGFQNHAITIKGMMVQGSIGATETMTLAGSNYKILTPTRLLRIVTSGRKFYLNDYTLINYLNTADSEGYRMYFGNGIPVAVNTYDMEPKLSDDKKGIEFNISFTEDKD